MTQRPASGSVERAVILIQPGLAVGCIVGSGILARDQRNRDDTKPVDNSSARRFDGRWPADLLVVSFVLMMVRSRPIIKEF